MKFTAQTTLGDVLVFLEEQKQLCDKQYKFELDSYGTVLVKPDYGFIRTAISEVRNG